jgi:hypothetical protein
MLPEMPRRQLLQAGSTGETRHVVLPDALAPVYVCWGRRGRRHRTAARARLLCLQRQQTGMGVLPDVPDVVCGPDLHLHLCQDKVFCQFKARV